MTAEWVSAALAAGALVFAAGGFFWTAQNTRRQVNGVGRKLGKMLLYLQETADGEQRKRLTDILKD
jgi:hypothetical protein